jgi:hypothetical protein
MLHAEEVTVDAGIEGPPRFPAWHETDLACLRAGIVHGDVETPRLLTA